MKTLFTSIIISFFSATAFGQAGNLDSTFGVNGKVIYHVPGTINYNVPVAVAIQPNGKIIVSGSADFPGVLASGWFVTRFNSNGTLDSTFASGGSIWGYPINSGSGYAHSSVLQPDGKILMGVGENNYYYIMRYKTDGSVDQNFFSDSSNTQFRGYSLALQNDGKIIEAGGLSGTTTDAVRQYNANGTINSYFGFYGTVATYFDHSMDLKSIALQADGRIVTASASYDEYALVRYLNLGVIDSSFGINGIVIDSVDGDLEFPLSLAMQSDGRILLSYMLSKDFTYHFVLSRINVDGGIDSTFGTNGMVDYPVAWANRFSIAIQPDGKILAAGSVLLRYTIDGSLDSLFGTNGAVSASLNSGQIAIQSDGKIVVAGSASDDFVLGRYLSGLDLGIIDFSTTNSSVLIYPNPVQQTVALEYTLLVDESITITLYDVLGKSLKKFIDNQKRVAGSYKETLQLPNLPAGNYFLTINNGSQTMTVKMVKQ